MFLVLPTLLSFLYRVESLPWIERGAIRDYVRYIFEGLECSRSTKNKINFFQNPPNKYVSTGWPPRHTRHSCIWISIATSFIYSISGRLFLSFLCKSQIYKTRNELWLKFQQQKVFYWISMKRGEKFLSFGLACSLLCYHIEKLLVKRSLFLHWFIQYVPWLALHQQINFFFVLNHINAQIYGIRFKRTSPRNRSEAANLRKITWH